MTIISRIFSALALGCCSSILPALFMLFFLVVKNLPNIISGFVKLIRLILRESYRLYRFVLSPLQNRIIQITGFDIFAEVPRSIISTILSEVIGICILKLISQPVLAWELIVLGLHGLLVGFLWDGILRSHDFQLGVGLE